MTNRRDYNKHHLPDEKVRVRVRSLYKTLFAEGYNRVVPIIKERTGLSEEMVRRIIKGELK